MADYSTIKGFTIQSLASDPYTSEGAAGTWASGGDINQTRNFGGGLGIQTAGMFVGGSGGGSTGNETETYDGTSWTAKNPINTIRNRMGVATQSPITASLIFGGSQPNTAPGYKNETETFDGTSWTTVPATLNTSRREFGGSAGASNSAALGFSGYTTTYITNVEEYDGSTWAEESDVNTARGVGGGGGTSADALFVAGLNPSFSAATETWDGTSWTSSNNANNARSYFGSGVTSSTSGLIFGGDAGPVPSAIDDKTESWNGTSWTELADMANQREGCKGCGTSSLALAFGGYSPGQVTVSEEWTIPSTVSVAQEGQVWYNTTSTVLKGFGLTLGSGAWASGTVVNTGRLNASAAGVSQDSAVFMGGAPVGGTAVAITEQYDGTTWTEVGDLNIPRKLFVGIGTQTAAIAAGGVAPTPTPVGPNLQECEQWNGTSWTEIADLVRSDTPPVSTSYAMGFGTTTSAIFAGGAEGDPGQLSLSEQWNGTSWTEGNDLTHSMGYGAMAGTSGDSGLITGGGTFVPAWDAYDGNQVWNGTSWSEENNLNQKRYGCIGSCQGTVSDSVVFGGNTNAPAASADTEHWNGTCWTELANLATGRWYLGGAGVGTNALAISGNAPPTTAVVEEWTIPSSYTTKTFTAS